MSNQQIKVAVIHIYSFPEGLAPTTRITAYCKGLKSLGAEVDILSIRPQTGKNRPPLKGECDGGNYYHFCYPPKIKIPIIRSIFWRFRNSFCLWNALYFVLKSHKLHPYDAFILSFDAPTTFSCVVPVIRRLKGSQIIAIADEYPIPIRKYLKKKVPTWKLWWYKLVYLGIDARILMTEKLQNFYDEKICIKPTMILSTIVDTERFTDKQPKHSEREYLCYMGNMELSKDNVDNIIKAFAIIKDEYPNLDLHMYGSPNNTDKKILTSLIDELDLGDRAIIKGRINYGEVPAVLLGAKVLVASQPDTKRAEGGFPTKMGEYFMTGKPCLFTDVGEISQYLKDGENGFIVAPENPELYAQKLRYILNNYDKALNTAKNAIGFVLDNYSSQSAGKQILDFIMQLKSKSFVINK